MTFLSIVLILAALLCALVAGFLFAFAVVVMPGIGRLGDDGFIRGFQVMDGVIQRNQPVFMLVWVGSVAAVVSAVAMGIGELDAVGHVLLILAATLWIFGVQLPTLAINVPLNNRLQRVDVGQASSAEHKAARAAFEARWNRWNVIRTMLACVATLLLLVLLVRL